MDKSTKLEKIHDRIEEVRTRFEVLRREVEIEFLRGQVAGIDLRLLEQTRSERLAALADDLAFLETCNIGGEFMPDDKIARVKRIAQQTFVQDGIARPLLTEDEVTNLCIRRGTLNDDDRKIINDHIVLTIQMLEALPFPKHLRNVPEIAGGHHEKMDGTGYPKGLKREEMSLPARMMGIADIFEALTAADRPYKKPKSLSESVAIMAKMRDDHHIDPDLFDLFLTSGVYLRYAERFLHPDQIDSVDITRYLRQNA